MSSSHQPREARFSAAMSKELLQRGFEEKKTKIPEPAALVSAELLRLFVKDAAERAKEEAAEAGDDTVTPEHLVRVLPQLLLDY